MLSQLVSSYYVKIFNYKYEISSLFVFCIREKERNTERSVCLDLIEVK